jgi:uncharacterized protein
MNDTPDKPRGRVFARIAAVRLVLFFFILAAAYAGAQVAVVEIAKRVPAGLKDAVLAGSVLAAAIVLIGIYVLLVRWLERRNAAELAPLRGAPLLLGGALLAFLMFCAVYGILWGLGCAQWRGFAGTGGVAGIAAMAIVSGVGEELVFRGGVYRILEDSLGTGLALLLSGAFFGGMHLLNPDATPYAAAAIALEAGVLLGAVYAASRSLWLPIGLHIGWNFTEGGVFGAAVSGGSGGHGMLNVPLSGPEWLTGGAFGPEASVVTVGVCLAIALYFIARTVRKRRWVPASFHMMLD